MTSLTPVLPAGARGSRILLAAATVVATVATAGSLFLSEGWGFVPCTLCWYQRILMYPLVVVFGVATLDGNGGVWKTALPLSIGGTALSAYHSWLQIRPTGGGTSCSVGSCGVVQYRLAPLGLTIPNLALIAFALLTVAGLALWRREGRVGRR